MGHIFPCTAFLPWYSTNYPGKPSSAPTSTGGTNMSRRSRNVWCSTFLAGTLAVLSLLGSPQGSLAQGDDKKPTAVKKFVRLKENDKGQPVAFQTALGRYAS